SLLLGHLKNHTSRAEKRGLVIRGHENESLEAKEIIEQSSFQNELHQTRTRVQQTLVTDRGVPDCRVHRIRAGGRIIRAHPRRPRAFERAKRLLIRLSWRHQQPDDPGGSVYNADLRDGNPRSLHDVHEHTLRVSSETGVRIPSVRNDDGSNLHRITLRPYLRQYQPTLNIGEE